MSDSNELEKYEEVYQKEFESKSTDPGVAYVENYFKRKYETINDNDVISALKYAAAHGRNSHGHLAFVRYLLSKDLVYRTNKEQRKLIFLKAAKHDADEEKFI